MPKKYLSTLLFRTVEEKELLELFIEASKLMSRGTDRCGNLIYTQKKDGKNIIREPEATYVVAHLLSEKGVDFGLEVPTKKYLFKSKKEDVGDTDLAIEPTAKQINIEFKRDQPNVESIKKDFVKLLGEQTDGCAFFHILKNTDSGTLPILLEKYIIAYNNSLNLKDRYPKWFLLFIFVKEKKECFWQLFDDIINISEDDFIIDNFSRENLNLLY